MPLRRRRSCLAVRCRHRAFTQLVRILPLCRHGPESSQVSEPPKIPGVIQLAEDLVGGELGVEDQQAGIAAGGLLPAPPARRAGTRPATATASPRRSRTRPRSAAASPPSPPPAAPPPAGAPPRPRRPSRTSSGRAPTPRPCHQGTTPARPRVSPRPPRPGSTEAAAATACPPSPPPGTSLRYSVNNIAKVGQESRECSKNEKKLQVRLPVTPGKKIAMSGVLNPSPSPQDSIAEGGSDETSTEIHAINPPNLPLTRDTRMERESSGFPRLTPRHYWPRPC